MKNYLLSSKNIIDVAEKEILNAAPCCHSRESGNLIMQSAEKGWLASVEATNALLQKRGIKIPKGTKRRQDLLFELEDKGKKISELCLGEKYSHFLQSLHSDCFYDGDVSVKRVRRDLRKVREFISEIEKI